MKLKKVVEDNFKDVIGLEPKETQKEFYPDNNVVAIAESTLHGHFHLYHNRAIYADEKVVGFVQYQFGVTGEADEDECTIWRFMIDKNHQNKGIGKAAMELLLKEIKAHQQCKLIDLYYEPQNLIAKKLYHSFGFKEVGDRDDGTIIAALKID